MQALAEIQDVVGRLAGSVGGSVVGIGHRWALGSGVVVAPGRVLTNAHNLRRDQVTVTFSDDRSVTATPVGVDVDGDLAILEVDTGDAPTIEWGNGAPALGAPVFALANPGGRGLRVTFGLISGT
ncbi:MAG: serine protease, partial [Actinomycetota bacterium]|nr:serine protease [Actinomycetota bacterium]